MYHICFFRTHLNALHRSEPLAILGSTPELRDLVAKLGFSNVYVIDNNASVYRALSQLRVTDSRENFLEGDWTEVLSRNRNHFCAVLSDLTSGNMPYTARGAFYAAISQALMPSGLFIDKVLTHGDTKYQLPELFAKFDDYPVNLLTINAFSCEVLFCSELLDRNHTVNSTEFYRILNRSVSTPTLKRFVSEARHITPRGTVWYYGRPWADLRRQYFEHLDLLNEEPEEVDSPYHNHLKLIVSRPKRTK